jgi:hypothetical protein
MDWAAICDRALSLRRPADILRIYAIPDLAKGIASIAKSPLQFPDPQGGKKQSTSSFQSANRRWVRTGIWGRIFL